MASRQEKIWQRLDMRRTPGLQGRGPDADESVESGPIKESPVRLLDDDYRFTVEGDFWRKSSDLACNRDNAAPINRAERDAEVFEYAWDDANNRLMFRPAGFASNWLPVIGGIT